MIAPLLFSSRLYPYLSFSQSSRAPSHNPRASSAPLLFAVEEPFEAVAESSGKLGPRVS